jgi:hypothetical protein
MTATTARNEHPVKALKKQSLICQPLTAKRHYFSRKLPMTLGTTLSCLTPSVSEQNMQPSISDNVHSDACTSTIHRTTTSILESLRRRYVHRGLGQTIVAPTCTSNKQLSVVTKPMLNTQMSSERNTTPAVVSPRTSCCDVTTFEPEENAITSPLRIKSARRTVTPLKFDSSMLDSDSSDDTDSEDDDDTLSLNSNFSYVSENKENRQIRRPSIRFHSYVKVVEIPNRNTYTEKQKRRMWNGSSVIRKNAKRNRIEYEYEGSEWHRVVEEDKFRLINGRMVHPVHIGQCV